MRRMPPPARQSCSPRGRQPGTPPSRRALGMRCGPGVRGGGRGVRSLGQAPALLAARASGRASWAGLPRTRRPPATPLSKGASLLRKGGRRTRGLRRTRPPGWLRSAPGVSLSWALVGACRDPVSDASPRGASGQLCGCRVQQQQQHRRHVQRELSLTEAGRSACPREWPAESGVGSLA